MPRCDLLWKIIAPVVTKPIIFFYRREANASAKQGKEIVLKYQFPMIKAKILDLKLSVERNLTLKII